METVLKFDKCVLVKELNDKIKKVGDTFEIANVLDGSFLLREAKSKVAVGVISFEDFDKHFVPVENFTGWTPWQQIVGFDGQNDAYYRTNRKKVQVKFIADKVRAESFCHKDDDFNLYFGVQLAYLRCLKKAMTQKSEKLQKELYRLDKEIYGIGQAEKKMINLLND